MVYMNKYILGCVLLIAISACSKKNDVIVKQENIDISINASGELESKKRIFLGPPAIKRMWQYKLKFLLAENSAVEKGQLLMSFEDKSIVDKLNNKKGELAQAEKELENKHIQEAASEQELVLVLAEKKMEFEKAQRKAEIVDHSSSKNEQKRTKIDFAIAKNDFTLAQKKLSFHQDNTLSNIKRTQLKVGRLSAEVRLWQTSIERLKVKSPINGRIIYKRNFQGEKFSVGENVQMGQSVIEVAVVEQMQVKAQITEPDSGEIEIGQTVKISLDSAKDKIFNGTVFELGKVFREKSIQDKRKIFDVIIKLESVDTKLMRPGMSVRVEVIVNTLSQVLTLPKSAILKNPSVSNEETTVQVINSFTTESRTIKIDRVLKNKVIISSGVTAGERIQL